jgi:hypothetical protein
MGYIETILGYGGNHSNFPLTLLFKPLDPNKSTLTEDELEELLDNDSDEIELELQDDIYLEENPEQRFITIRYIDDIFYGDFNFISKKTGSQIRQTCCFCGIIISDDSEGKKDYDNKKYKEDNMNLEDKIAKTIAWAIELKLQARLSEDTKLVLVSNCCS